MYRYDFYLILVWFMFNLLIFHYFFKKWFELVNQTIELIRNNSIGLLYNSYGLEVCCLNRTGPWATLTLTSNNAKTVTVTSKNRAKQKVGSAVTNKPRSLKEGAQNGG